MFVPEKYSLSLELNRQDRVFGGIVTITGISQPGTNNVTLHSKDLTIRSIVFDGKVTDFSFNKNDELVITRSDLVEGKHIIVIDFVGKITDSMHGIYPCYYEHDGNKKELLATQFESHHAREVFPCIDEPEAKSIFDLTLTTENNVSVLGNMPNIRQYIDNDKLVTIFETTPVMSSYLLAWVVGELHKKTALTKRGVEVNVWTTLAQDCDSLDFALDIATRSIDFLDEYFKTPYPLPKCDHVALPDFSSGAMENWGLITYREMALLANPNYTSISTKHYIASVITHELSHQWFGNLVTMRWWNDLWLNESFASMIEYTALDTLEPKWNVWLDFASFEVIAALRRDSINGVQPVQTDVNQPDEIYTLFDGAIVYAKGARLLKMLKHYIGEKSFRNGIAEYFKTFAYKNTESHDLWSALSHSSGKDVAKFMDIWIKQPGFPVLSVTRDGNVLRLSQKRLSCLPSKTSDELWPITLNSNCHELPDIFDIRSSSFNINNNKEVPRFNIGNDAHYITHYDKGLMKQLVDQLKKGKLSSMDRLQLLNEQSILARAGITNSADLIDLICAFKSEGTESVWDIISLIIADLKKFVLDDEDAESRLRALAGSLAQNQYQKLGWDAKTNEPETNTKLRGIVISLMLYSEESNVVNLALDVFNSWPIDEINPELRGVILSSVIRHRDSNESINSLIDTYKTTNSSELKQDIVIGLTSSRNNKIIKRILGLIKNTSVIRTQDINSWISHLMHSKYACEQTWRWVRDNWGWIEDKFDGDKSYDEYPSCIANALSTRKQLEEYRTFFKLLSSNPALKRTIMMGISEISNKVDLIERDSDTIKAELLKL